MNLLAIGLDYLMLQKDNVRGDVRQRQFDYARRLGELHLVVYSPRSLGLRKEQWADNLWVHPTNSKNKFTFIFDACRICQDILKQRKIDAITTEDPFTTGLVGYFLKMRFKVPLNVQAHIDFCDNEYWMRMRLLNRLFNLLGKFICKRADTIRVVARETKEKLEKYGIPSHKIRLISVHSDLTRFKAADGEGLRRELLSRGFSQILIFVGRLVPQKDIPNLLQAFRLVLKKKPKTLLLIVGKGPEEAALKRAAEELGVAHNIIFTGAIEHTVIPQYYAASDIFVLPSIFEGRATVLVEAILAKKPIVTTDVSGVYDWVIGGESGFIVSRKNPAQLAEKIIYLLNQPELIKHFGEKGFALAQIREKEIGDIGSMIALWEETAQCKS